jgi:trehalose/maltose hydrolase-like predicted phosphorylase
MMEALEPTRDPGWVLTHEGYNVLTENAVESRFALGNGFLGMRASRPVSRGPDMGQLAGLYQVGVVAALLRRGRVRQT